MKTIAHPAFQTASGAPLYVSGKAPGILRKIMAAVRQKLQLYSAALRLA